MDQPTEPTDVPAAACDVVHLCTQWLEEEEQFQRNLGKVLLRLSQASPFSNRPSEVSSSCLLELSVQRAALQQQHSFCRSILARLLNCNRDETHLSSLENMLPSTERSSFRAHRLRVSELIPKNQQLLRSVEVRLSCCSFSVNTLLKDLLGQPPLHAGYGADGHQAVPSAVSTLHAVS